MDGQAGVSDQGGTRPPGPKGGEKDLGRLTPGERLWLWRQSLPSKSTTRRGYSLTSNRERVHRVIPMNQMEAAVHLGVEPQVYWAAENDVSEKGESLALLAKVQEPPYRLPDALKVARRRSPMRLPEVADKCRLGSRPTFYKLEREGDPRIVAFWREQGYRFPKKLTSD